MSDNKSKYYVVTTTSVVRANSKRDAVDYVKGSKYQSATGRPIAGRSNGAVALTAEVDAVRISAVEARVKTA